MAHDETGPAAAEPKGAKEGKKTGPPAVDEDETRRKFREALDRKQHREHASAESAERDGSEKSHGATGPTKGRTFRRKSI